MRDTKALESIVAGQITLRKPTSWDNPVFCTEVGAWVSYEQYKQIKELVAQGYTFQKGS